MSSLTPAKVDNTASAKSFGRNAGGQIFATVGVKSNLNPQ